MLLSSYLMPRRAELVWGILKLPITTFLANEGCKLNVSLLNCKRVAVAPNSFYRSILLSICSCSVIFCWTSTKIFVCSLACLKVALRCWASCVRSEIYKGCPFTGKLTLNRLNAFLSNLLRKFRGDPAALLIVSMSLSCYFCFW